jgi:hypothetical protein
MLSYDASGVATIDNGSTALTRRERRPPLVRQLAINVQRISALLASVPPPWPSRPAPTAPCYAPVAGSNNDIRAPYSAPTPRQAGGGDRFALWAAEAPAYLDISGVPGAG